MSKQQSKRETIEYRIRTHDTIYTIIQYANGSRKMESERIETPKR